MSDIKEKTLKLIDGLKATCQSYGMGNDGNEYKIITQVFLYKFLNDKFGYELKNAKSDIAKKLTGDVKWETAYENLSGDERMLIQSAISPDVPMLEPYHLIANLWNQQSKGDFDTIFDSTMTDIAEKNADIFSTQTTANTRIPLFEALTPFVTDTAQRAPFARALVDKLVNFSFEEAFAQNSDLSKCISKIGIVALIRNYPNSLLKYWRLVIIYKCRITFSYNFSSHFASLPSPSQISSTSSDRLLPPRLVGDRPSGGRKWSLRHHWRRWRLEFRI